jgi:ribosomal protein S18 acetylase RimI-like enzyme
MSPLTLITDRAQITVADVREVFAHASWTERRTPAQILTMLDNSPLLVLARLGDRPAGFARALTDFVFRCFIEDVIVIAGARQCGIGRRLVGALEQQMCRLGLDRAELTTQQMDFWRRLGYEENERSTYLRKQLRGPASGKLDG